MTALPRSSPGNTRRRGKGPAPPGQGRDHHRRRQRHRARRGGGARFVVHDVRDEESWTSLIAGVIATEGALHVLVNAAGILGSGERQDPERTTLEEWRSINAVNLDGVFLGCKAAIPAIREARGIVMRRL